ncbi:lytic transglycosylase domain-containing protein [Collimonas fungivorans]|uniref:PilT n=1 Tax=Collimonas fungivorans (strain Ter331) TaxID=1005048 RepID=G0AFP7_COLFT|nr:PilT [Collimonas fungivorans Ter331]
MKTKKNYAARRIGWIVLSGLASMLLPTDVARADCFDDAAIYHGVNPTILRAIAWQESNNRADAIHVNSNGSIDYGVMQINSVHLAELAKYGVRRQTLLQPCQNVYIAAWHLRRMVSKYGNNWKAVGAYHSEQMLERDGYAKRIQRIVAAWSDIPPSASNRLGAADQKSNVKP